MKKWTLMTVCVFLSIFLSGCGEGGEAVDILPRESVIPADAVKILPETDIYPPKLHAADWEEPAPLPAPINTAGAEDSPFITPDGQTLYFFFTPDPQIPVQDQLSDGATGIYVSRKTGAGWQDPQRVLLQDPDKLALDGCQFVQGDVIWFCSAREGYQGMHWFTAEHKEGSWTNWQSVDFDPAYEVGELHISADGDALYFHSPRPGGKGGYDVWLSRKVQEEWGEPENLAVINSPEDDGWPFLSQDGSELWFLRTYRGTPALFRSLKGEGGWEEPEMIISQFAGEPSLDEEGNLYFVHHFFEGGQMIEADIYLAKKK